MYNFQKSFFEKHLQFETLYCTHIYIVYLCEFVLVSNILKYPTKKEEPGYRRFQGEAGQRGKVSSHKR